MTPSKTPQQAEGKAFPKLELYPQPVSASPMNVWELMDGSGFWFANTQTKENAELIRDTFASNAHLQARAACAGRLAADAKALLDRMTLWQRGIAESTELIGLAGCLKASLAAYRASAGAGGAAS